MTAHMPNKRPVILIELNELTPSLMNRFIDEGKLPNFKRFRDASQVYTTDAGESGMSLNPWIQWVTVHTGARYADHGVFLLGEGEALEQPTLSELASRAGLRVWQCGSMNIPIRPGLNGAGLPDAWATEAQPTPVSLEPFFRFVSRNVQEHTQDSLPLSPADYADFLRFMVTHGLSAETVRKVVSQLLRERSGQYKWQRVAILDQLQWDVFRHTYRKLRPDFATFFANSVAHLQHTHWRNLEPEQFAIQPTAEEQREFENAILFGYQANDAMLGQFLEFAGDECTLVFCTALSQQACVEWEDQGAKRFYRPRDFGALTAFAGITARHTCAPVMSEEFWVEFENETEAKHGEQRLADLRVADREAFSVKRKGTRIYAGCGIFDEIKPDAALVSVGLGTQAPFFDLLYQADSLKSGVHHPDGMFWVRDPDRIPRVHQEKVPLTAVAPTLVSLLGLEPPASMSTQPLL